MSASAGRAAPARLAYDDLCLDPFRALPERTWSRELHAANGIIDQAVDQACRVVLDALEVAPGSASAAARESSGTVAERAFALDWMLARLGSAPAPAAHDPKVADVSLGSTLALIEAAQSFYPSWLRGEVDGRAFFRRPDVLALWEAYFHDENIAYAVINELAAHAAESQLAGSDLRVLELGGGLGSAAVALLERIRTRVGSYLFTDFMPVFLRRGFERVSSRFGELATECARLDFNRPLGRQGIEPASFDVAVAVNALHAARDLNATLSEIRTALAPNGSLVLGEAVRPRRGSALAIEFVFQLADDFQNIVVEPESRPHGGFLWHGDWRRALERAGFDDVRLVPEPSAAAEAYPGYSLSAFVARGADG